MSQAVSSPSPRLATELKVSGNLMTLDAGVYCVFHTPGRYVAADETGLPGVRLSLPPAAQAGAVEIVAFRTDGWLGARDGAALVRVRRGPAQILVTVYQAPGGGEPPRLQVLRLSDPPAQPAAAPQEAFAPRAEPVPATPPQAAVQAVPHTAPGPQRRVEIGAHVQGRGDVAVPLGEWIGDRGSRRWIEGFAVAPQAGISAEDIEYQALLGRGWLSPWSEGGKFCGSRGMALPILGIRVRLRGAAADAYDCVYAATFVDGSSAGPVANGQPCEASSLAPVEAFTIELRPRVAAPDWASGQTAPGTTPAARKRKAAVPAAD